MQIAGEWTNGGVRLLVPSDGRDPEREVQLSDLPKLTEAQRRRLRIESQGTTAALQDHRTIVDFHSPSVIVHPFDTALRDRLVTTLLANGKPTVDPRRLRALRPVAVAVLLAGLWLWCELVSPLTVPGHLLGWAAAITVLTIGWRKSRASLRTIPISPSLRVALETRLDAIRRRSDSKRDVKVAALSVLGTIAAGVVVAAIAFSAGWSPGP